MLELTKRWLMEPMAFVQLSEIIEANRDKLQAGPAGDGARDGLPMQVLDDLAIITTKGPMLKNQSFFGLIFGLSSYRSIQEATKAAMQDEAINTILYVWDTPGGMVDGVVETGEMIQAAGKIKQTVSQVDGDMMSAGMWLGSQANKIYAGKGDMVGSIGVRLMMFDYSKMLDEEGIKPVVIDTGKFKSAGAFGTEITDEHKKYFQELIDADFGQFKRAVMFGRGLSESEFAAVADGKVYQAEKGAALGLVDGIQFVGETIAQYRTPQRRGRTTQTAQVQLKKMLMNAPSRENMTPSRR